MKPKHSEFQYGERIVGSYKDPMAKVYRSGDSIYRIIQASYAGHYKALMQSGLYKALVESKALIEHAEIENIDNDIVISPQTIPFISYPYEWPFSQLKDAALLTLDIQKQALDHGMTLKDASAKNVQYLHGGPIFIDTSSFEIYEDDAPWFAYKQFCENFLAPLVLMAKIDPALNLLTFQHLDGIPLELCAALLKWHHKISPSVFTHIIMHSVFSQREPDSQKDYKIPKVTKQGQYALIDSLKSSIEKLTLKSAKKQWDSYYDMMHYSTKAAEDKYTTISNWVDELSPKNTLDIGANTGRYSLLCAERKISTLSIDSDHACIDRFYSDCKAQGKEKYITPLCIDFVNPSPAVGWENLENDSFIQRAQSDMVLFLALIHHVVIGKNVPFEKVAQCLSFLTQSLIIEFVPSTDSQVVTMMKARKELCCEYSQDNFEASFSRYFSIVKSHNIDDTGRILYMMKKKA